MARFARTRSGKFSLVLLSLLAACGADQQQAASPSGQHAASPSGHEAQQSTASSTSAPVAPGQIAWPDVSAALDGVADGEKDAALIVAIERYAFLAPVPGAFQNGQDWYKYLTGPRGLRTERVRFLANHEATDFAILSSAEELAKQVPAGGKLWFVFVGHGAPSEDAKDGLLVAADAQQSVAGLERRSVPQAQLLAALSKGQGTPVAIIDACYSGKSSSGDLLVPGLQPSAVVRTAVPSQALIFSAAGSSEFAGPLPGAERPAFSYLMLGGLRGWADANADGRVTPREAVDYANSTLRALLAGSRSQTPELHGAGVTELSRAQEKGPQLADLVLQLKAASAPAHVANPVAPVVAPSQVAQVTAPAPTPDSARSSVSSSPAPSTNCPEGMVALPGGTFKMGSRRDQVTVKAYCLDATEVTAAAYASCVQSGLCSEEGLACNASATYGATYGVSGKESHPINCVDWGQAATYCNVNGKRLPTEEEWEWAARGGSRGWKYPWGNEEPDFQLCWSGVSERSGSCAVGSFRKGDAPGGIHDLSGNVAEWTSTRYSRADGDPARVFRGGSWISGSWASVLSKNISSYSPTARSREIGFRCAR